MKKTEKNFKAACECYAAVGVDVEKALDALEGLVARKFDIPDEQ